MTLMPSPFLIESALLLLLPSFDLSLSIFEALPPLLSLLPLLSLPSLELPLFVPSFPLFPSDFPPIPVIEERVFIKLSSIPNIKQHY